MRESMHGRRHSILRCIALFTCSVLLIFGLIIPEAASAQSGSKLIVHYVEGAFSTEKNAFVVKAYVSVLDGDGKPITGLTAGDFSVSEDSQMIQVDTVETAVAPMNLVLVVDTSGSMARPIEDARRSAQSFIASLGSEDQVAVISFNEMITRESGFTKDFVLVSNRIQRITVTPGAGTCLYDAAYEAVQVASTLPAGRRGIILLTDGKDENRQQSAPCSTHTMDDVISLAAKGNTRTPVYTLSLGNLTDDKGLARIAELTGGVFRKSPDSSQLKALFADLSSTLKSEYVLTFTSNSAAGPHTVVVENGANVDSRDYVLPPIPPSVKVLSLSDGQKVEGKLQAEAQVSAQGKVISEVVFRLNGSEVGRDDISPYTIQLEPLVPGTYTLEVSVNGEDGQPLATSSVSFSSILLTATPEPLPTDPPSMATVLPPGEEQGAEGRKNSALMGGAAGAGLLIVVAIIAFIMLSRRKRAGSEQLPVGGTLRSSTDIPSRPLNASTVLKASPQAFATLSVLQSDDPGMVNQELNLTAPETSLGRSTQNDIIFPKDSPVSRQHARIEQKNRQLWLEEICTADETGAMNRPRYGTFVNDTKLGEKPVLLSDGDVIRLGSRVRLQVKLPRAAAQNDVDKTIDSLEDKTLDDHVLDDQTLEDAVDSTYVPAGSDNDHTLTD